MISFALESPGLIVSLSLFSVNVLCCFYYYCETTDTVDENLDLSGSGSGQFTGEMPKRQPLTRTYD